MTGVEPITVSPCSCMIRRNTPCVLGCCGPRFSVSRLSSSTTPSSPGSSKMVSPSSGPSAGVSPGISVSAMAVSPDCVTECSVRLVNELLDGDVVVVGLVIATHREADEVVRQQDAAQVGVAQEADAHHLEGLALHEFGAGPDGRERGDRGHAVARQLAAQDRAERLGAVVVAEQVVDELQAILPVDLADERQVVEAVGPEQLCRFEQALAGDFHLGVAVAPLEGGALDGVQQAL